MGVNLQKTQLIGAVIERLEADKEGLKTRFRRVHEEIVDAPTPTQSHSDQTRFQLSQVANEIDSAFASKDEGIRDLKSLLVNLSDEDFASKTSERVMLGSLVEAQHGSGSEERYFVLPAGGGIEVPDKAQTTIVITPAAPVAVALMGKVVGDEVIARFGKRTETLKITAIY